MNHSYEAKYQCLFPYNWHVDVQTVLSRYETPEMVDVPVLVSALRTTMQFERVRERKGSDIVGVGIEDGSGQE